MAKQIRSTSKASGPWVAPPRGGYSAESRKGETVQRPESPPKNAASATRKAVT